ncbi:hypothetical protein DNH61_06280 [Paenibacillus sambharensis]|uniref:Uncharacterized protein n=1 Tax=Paenibacillus sambharensis TaxID=1803190 RepID=A0A2W1LYP9_9BACL|nr:hypothetical protein DNH61_06280 [Paenibacillus sambharensis]
MDKLNIEGKKVFKGYNSRFPHAWTISLLLYRFGGREIMSSCMQITGASAMKARGDLHHS